MKKRLQIALGLRSSCCAAKIVSWHSDKYYCAQCEAWLSTANTVKAPKSSIKSKRLTPRQLTHAHTK